MLVRLDSSAHGGINPGLPGNAYTALVKENGVYVYILKSANIKTKATGPCGEAQYQIFPSVNSENAGIVANFGLAFRIEVDGGPSQDWTRKAAAGAHQVTKISFIHVKMRLRWFLVLLSSLLEESLASAQRATSPQSCSQLNPCVAAYGGINPGLPGSSYHTVIKEPNVYTYILNSPKVDTAATGPCGKALYNIVGGAPPRTKNYVEWQTSQMEVQSENAAGVQKEWSPWTTWSTRGFTKISFRCPKA
ncbi:unnamed protein product [Jaminaea pallidilutea]